MQNPNNLFAKNALNKMIAGLCLIRRNAFFMLSSQRYIARNGYEIRRFHTQVRKRLNDPGKWHSPSVILSTQSLNASQSNDGRKEESKTGREFFQMLSTSTIACCVRCKLGTKYNNHSSTSIVLPHLASFTITSLNSLAYFAHDLWLP